jgi:hypothetical protein
MRRCSGVNSTGCPLRNDASVVAAGVAAPPARGFLYAVAVCRNPED